MGTFKHLEHTADIALILSGKDFNDLLETAAEAFKYLVVGELKFRSNEQKDFSVVASSREEILVNLLSELNYLLAEKRFITNYIDSISISNEDNQISLRCRFLGFTDIKNEIEIKEEIKAVTFHKIEIIEDENGITTPVIFDI